MHFWFHSALVDSMGQRFACFFTSIVCDIKARPLPLNSTLQTAHMESQTDHPYVGHYHLPYSNPNMREGPWLPEPYYHTPDYYQSLSTVAAPPPAQGIMIDLHCQPQVMGDAEYSTTSDDADATQVYPHSFDTGDLPINPIGGMVAVNVS